MQRVTTFILQASFSVVSVSADVVVPKRYYLIFMMSNDLVRVFVSRVGIRQ